MQRGGQCVISCTKGNYLYQDQCLKCHDNCLSCSGGIITDNNGKLINMQCTECKHELTISGYIKRFLENKIEPDLNKLNTQTPKSLNQIMIQNEGNCFPIILYNEYRISFDITEIDPIKKIGTCLYFNKSIFFGEEICKEKPDNTFYVLNGNDNTGVIKNCSIACYYCLGDFSKDNTNCINCSSGYYKTEDSDSNCILESLIKPNYYKNISDNIYYKCHSNCYNCSNGFD